ARRLRSSATICKIQWPARPRLGRRNRMAMKLTTGILAIAMTTMAGAAWSVPAVAQNPDAIDNARSIAKSLQQKQANDSNAALDAAGVPAPSAKPAPGS